MLKPTSIAAFALLLSIPAFAQGQSGDSSGALVTAQPLQTTALASQADEIPAVKMITGFKKSDIKFNLDELVDILRDRRHEGWVLAAYPDPRTGQPLIGAGFSLDLPERDHPQTDPLNSHPFLEPASADLWLAAGFDSGRLNDILKVFYERKRAWNKRKWRRQIYSLPAQITDDDATQLVRVGAIQAIYNAQAYCRKFDQLSGPQQMAMAQLVYQMGVNLQHFTDFLATINLNAPAVPTMQTVAEESSTDNGNAVAALSSPDQTPEYWQSVQKSLMGSQWAHKYRTRAIAVIAMLDPAYGDDPTAAEQRVSAVLRPAVAHRRHSRAAVSTRQVATAKHRPRVGRSSKSRSRNGSRA